MESLHTLEVPPATVLALQEYLRISDSKLSVRQAVVLAIREWCANSGGSTNASGTDILRGYQWKTVFLPHATQLRMTYAGDSYYAKVVGDSIMFEGRKVSPREFVMHITGTGRNAWRDISIRFPESRQWKGADLCRIELRNQLPAASPVDVMTAAAASMSEALKTALMLVENANAEAVRKFERRLDHNRRASDRDGGDCSFH